MQGVFLMSVVVGVLAIMFYTPYMFAKGMVFMEYGVVVGSDKLKCAIPVYNVAMAERLYMGKGSKTVWFTLLFAFSIGLRFVNIFMFTDLMLMHMITTIFMLLAVLAFYICNCWLVFAILNDTGVIGFMGKICMSILYPIGFAYIGTHLPNVVKNMTKQTKVFK